jgi:hypothetical protein
VQYYLRPHSSLDIWFGRPLWFVLALDHWHRQDMLSSLRPLAVLYSAFYTSKYSLFFAFLKSLRLIGPNLNLSVAQSSNSLVCSPNQCLQGSSDITSTFPKRYYLELLWFYISWRDAFIWKCSSCTITSGRIYVQDESTIGTHSKINYRGQSVPVAWF